jgi:hypothetical protein
MEHDIVRISKRKIGTKVNNSVSVRYTKTQVEAMFKNGFGKGTSFSVDDDGSITVIFDVDSNTIECIKNGTKGISISSKCK